MAAITTINIRFDGPPGPEGPRFVEAENPGGTGLRVGRWFQADGEGGDWFLQVLMKSWRLGVSEDSEPLHIEKDGTRGLSLCGRSINPEGWPSLIGALDATVGPTPVCRRCRTAAAAIEGVELHG